MPDTSHEPALSPDLLCNREFQLLDNVGGHVTGATVMRFGDEREPWLATYAGPNVVIGQVMVEGSADDLVMLYQARTTDGKVVAGCATVKLLLPNSATGRLEFQLQWQWLYGDRGQGMSHWCQL